MRLKQLASRFIVSPWQLPLRAIVTFSFLAYFLLPNTLWGESSVTQYLLRFLSPLPQPVQYLGICLLSLFVLAVFLFIQRSTVLPGVRQDKGKWLLLLMAVYFLPMIITIAAAQPFPTLRASIFLLLSSLLVGLVATIFARSVRLMGIVLVLLATVQSIYAIYYHKMGINTLESGDLLRAGGTLGHPSGVYTFMMLTLPLAVAFLLERQKPLQQVIWIFASAMIFAALMLTWYRGGILGAVVGLVWLVAMRFRKKKTTVLISLCLAIVFIFVMAQRSAGDVNKASANRSVVGRYLIWNKGVQIFQKNWITGVGIGCLKIPTTTATRDSGVFTSRIHMEPKNMLLHWLCELGIGGGLLFLLFVMVIFKIVSERHTGGLAQGVGAAWIAFLVAGIFDTLFGTANRTVGNVLTGCLLGMTVVMAQSPVEVCNENKNEYTAFAS